jgi:hypothetical protein
MTGVHTCGIASLLSSTCWFGYLKRPITVLNLLVEACSFGLLAYAEKGWVYLKDQLKVLLC